MALHPDWKRILRHAWSIRLIALAGILSALDAAWPYLPSVIQAPPWVFAAGAGFVSCGAIVARLVAQARLSRAG
jgi:hypothetical protein